MVDLGISVSLANILLWAIVEIFILLMGMTATSLIARHYLNRSLQRGNAVTLNRPPDLVDKLPYNGDLHPTPQSFKFMLTAFRLLIVACSIYIGTGLDGDLEEDNRPFPVSSSVSVAPFPGGLLTSNSGNDIAAMIKLSCLRIVNNNNVIFYKGFAGGGDIACQDGLATFEAVELLNFEIRAGFQTPETGLDITGMNIQGSTAGDGSIEGIQRFSDRIIMNVTDPLDTSKQISTRAVLMERLQGDLCLFGIWRSPGAGFEGRVDTKLISTCELQIVGMERLLRPKPESLPPRMSFVYQVMDGILVSNRETNAPRMKGDDVIATVSVPALVVGGIAVLISGGLALVFALAVRSSVIDVDLLSAGGIINVWGNEKGERTSEELVVRWSDCHGARGGVVRVREGDGGGRGSSGDVNRTSGEAAKQRVEQEI